MIKAQRGAALLVAGPIGAVDEQNVLPAVAVVVQKSASGAESLGQEFSAESSAIVLEVNSRLSRYVRKMKAERRWRVSLPDQRIQSRRKLRT